MGQNKNRFKFLETINMNSIELSLFQASTFQMIVSFVLANIINFLDQIFITLIVSTKTTIMKGQKFKSGMFKKVKLVNTQKF